MEIYSFNNLDIQPDGYYDLEAKSVVNDLNIDVTLLQYFIVTDEYVGRIDLVSKYLYGVTTYVEELMVMNNIMNPFSIDVNDFILAFIDPSNFYLLYKNDPPTKTNKDQILLMNKEKTTQKDANRLGSVPTIRPDNLQQVQVDYNKKKITIINKFQ